MSLSDTVDISSGVVQVPVWVRCYLCYISMMSLLLFDDKIRCKLYADDVKVYSVVNTQADSLAM